MLRLLELLFLAAIVLLSVTEFFYPLVVGKPLFGSFRKKVASTEPLVDKIAQAKEKVQEVKDVQNEASSNFKSAETLKKEADDLLKL